jgi:hypothetical protein
MILDALTSTSYLINNFTTRLFSSEEAAWRGNTPSRAELIGDFWRDGWFKLSVHDESANS